MRDKIPKFFGIPCSQKPRTKVRGLYRSMSCDKGKEVVVMKNSMGYSLIRTHPNAISQDACLALREAGYTATVNFPTYEQREVNIGTLKIDRVDDLTSKILGIYGFVLGGRTD